MPVHEVKYSPSTGRLIGICGVYVDDSIMIFSPDKEGQSALKSLKALYTWGSWDEKNFKLCGVQRSQKADFSVHLSQAEYVQHLRQAPHRRRARGKPDSPRPAEVKQLRGINGELQWLATNNSPSLAAGVSISSGTVNTAEISDRQEANRLIRMTHSDKDLKLIFSPIPLTSLRWITFSDSSWANRHDGFSQGGAIHLLADGSILD